MRTVIGLIVFHRAHCIMERETLLPVKHLAEAAVSGS
jgi:hypothetical protein